MAHEVINTNARSYPSEYGGYVEVTAVLVSGGIGDYAVYVGVGSDEWIADHGDKLSFEEAYIHFPVGLERSKYRD